MKESGWRIKLCLRWEDDSCIDTNYHSSFATHFNFFRPWQVEFRKFLGILLLAISEHLDGPRRFRSLPGSWNHSELHGSGILRFIVLWTICELLILWSNMLLGITLTSSDSVFILRISLPIITLVELTHPPTVQPSHLPPQNQHHRHWPYRPLHTILMKILNNNYCIPLQKPYQCVHHRRLTCASNLWSITIQQIFPGSSSIEQTMSYC